MGCVLLAVSPCALVGVVNAGYQVLGASRRQGLERLPGWLGEGLAVLGLPAAPESVAACLLVGLGRALPMLAVAGGIAWAWARLFARLRGRASSEAIPVVVVLFALSLPPAIPLWQVALGISFAVVVGLEIFGGTGRNVVNPALAGLAFLYFTYPASFSGEGVWVGVAGADGTTVLRAASEGGLAALGAGSIRWIDTLVGLEPGALGETSALACLAGGVLLVYARLASWRVLAGGVLGLAITAELSNALADATRPLRGLAWHWHLTTGSFAFGLVFLATDPVTSAVTAAGRWAYGALIGFLVVVVRVFNPAHPEGVMVAILLANVLAPLLDRAVVWRHGLRRRRRLG